MKIMNGLKAIGSFFTEVVCPAAFAGLLIKASSNYKVVCFYSDAVNAITTSDMWSHDQQEAIAALPTYESSEFYGAVAEVAKSSMWSHDKLSTILKMCGKEEA